MTNPAAQGAARGGGGDLSVQPHYDTLTIALDARTVHRANRRGTGKNLIDLYQHVLAQRPHWRVIGYHRDDPDTGLSGTPGYTARLIEMPGDRFDAWFKYRFPMAAWRFGADVLHCPANFCCYWNPVPTMVTIHDLIMLDHDDRQARQLIRTIRHAVKHRLTIITPSEYTRMQLISRFNADPDQIVVNYWAADTGIRHITDPIVLRDVREKYNLPDWPFILQLGSHEPRKNSNRLLQAFGYLPDTVRENWTLLIIGVENVAFREHLAGVADRLGCADHVRVHGFADEVDMPVLFSAAEVLAYPSVSEGFGLPILDAFATHTAVLASDSTSLPEVGGEAVTYVDPMDVESIQYGLVQLMGNAGLRSQQVTQGLERLPQYNWQATASRFIDAVIRTVSQRRSRRASA